MHKGIAYLEESQLERVLAEARKAEVEGRRWEEKLFLIVNGYWPEDHGSGRHEVEFTVRGVRTVITTERVR